MRFKSDSGDAVDSEDTKSAQSKLDQLASYLENQPQESTKTVSRPQRVNQRKQSASGPRKQEQVGPTKSFQNGQYYDPYTLNPSNMTFQPRRRALPLLGPPKREAIQKDPIHILGLNPAKPSLADDTYKNGPLLSEFVTEMGKIQPRNITGLTRKSQRYVGKAIRRARALGILPVMSRGRGSKGGDWR
ncbi:hypothetical protein MPSI1_000412 [Malassezia psittaci]|uniref:Small ribosomal subunit protein bS18m n=1 Tax=Malassezia psittaci TaxID=1821823 RepID=A0AAF0JIK5_9BASI|nr:hypothetical protein MPSI1_000412 [Malassezia psittaci]